MILSKSDLDYYIKEDAKESGYSLDQTVAEKIHSFFYPDYKKEYMITLRKLEYYGMNGGGKETVIKKKDKEIGCFNRY